MARYLAYKLAVYAGLMAFLGAWAIGLAGGLAGHVILLRASISAGLLAVLVGALVRATLEVLCQRATAVGELEGSPMAQPSTARHAGGGNGNGNGNGNGKHSAGERLKQELLPPERDRGRNRQ